ncbi:MAG: leucine-rich repeat domain-containing protein, partial [Spirochaetaceae bacterium]|nr:leucine-rich repeat domain-containing protein [Spirochaetaceae bacterium]
IGDHAFAYCDNLASVSLPKATDIGSAFIGCTNLATVSLPKATTIGGHAFSQTGNTDLTVTLGSTVPALGDAMFSDVTDAKTVTVKVPNVAAWTNITGNYAETSNYTVNWGNGFRGGGWTQAGAFVSYGQIKNNITLTVTTIQ